MSAAFEFQSVQRAKRARARLIVPGLLIVLVGGTGGCGSGRDATAPDAAAPDAAGNVDATGDSSESDEGSLARDGGEPSPGDAAADAARSRLCDGTKELKLRVYVEGNPGRDVRGSAVRVEQGLPSMAIDGACTYYVSGGWEESALSRDLGWRTGTLPPDLAEYLSTTLNLESLRELESDCKKVVVFDASPWVISSATSSAHCLSPGKSFADVVSTLRGRIPALWSEGRPMEGALHVSAVETSEVTPVYAWPLGVPLASFLLPDRSQYDVGVSFRVDDVSNAAALRALREQYLTDQAKRTPGVGDGLLTSDGHTTAYLYMRDALPYEDDRGAWPF